MTDVTRELRTGLTSGTCAAAAAKAAAAALADTFLEEVTVFLPGGEPVTLAVAEVERLGEGRARASVVKDAGDDPDITNGMTVVAEVERRDDADDGDLVCFAAGPGVGTVTLAGLQLAPGEPAINPVPRAMIAAAVAEVLPDVRVCVTVSIPGGEEIARRTFNPRLGVEGGLSVLGTSGRVVPKSEDAWLRSLLPQVQIALADGRHTVYLAPGRFGEVAARTHFAAAETAVVQCSNFVGDLLDHCVESGVDEVVLIGHAGKLVKVAAGLWNTHSRYGDARLETVAALAAAAGAPPPLVVRLLDLPTAEAAVAVLAETGFDAVWDDVADRVVMRAAERAARGAAGGAPPRFACAIVGYDGAVLGRSSTLRAAASETPLAPALSLTVVGTGPGAQEWITPAAWRLVRRAEVVAGGRRQLEAFAPEGAQQIIIGARMEELAAALSACAGRRIVVLASGDPGFFGISATLRRLLPDAHIVVLPGISSIQLAAARLGRPWHDMRLVSAHGSDVKPVVDAVASSPRVLALCDARHTPQALAAEVVAAGFAAELTVLERLGEPDERITSAAAAEIATGEFDGLSIVFIEREEIA